MVQSFWDQFINKCVNLLYENAQNNPVFEAKKDLQEVVNSISFRDLPEMKKASVLLDIFSAYYEAGFYLEKDARQWKIQAQFNLGNIQTQSYKSIQLPNTTSSRVLKTEAKNLIDKWQFELHGLKSDAQVVLIRPTPGVSFLLFSNFPNMILRDLSEQSLYLVQKAYSETVY